MLEIFKALLEFASGKSPRVFLSIASICLAVLAYPATWFCAAELATLVGSYRGYLLVAVLAGYTLALTTSSWPADFVSKSAKFIWGPVLRRNLKAQVEKSLAVIPSQEWLYLAYCVSRKQDTIYAPLGDAVAQSLTHKGFFRLADGAGHQSRWPHTINQDLLKVLKEHPKFAPTNLASHEDIFCQFDYAFSGRISYF